METTLVHINSIDADQVVDGSSFIKVLGSHFIEKKAGYRVRFSVESVVIPQGYYQTIRTGINDQIAVEIYDTGDVLQSTGTVTLNAGDYTVYELNEELSTQFASTMSGYEVTVGFSTTLKKINITFNTPGYYAVFKLVGTTAKKIIGLSTDLTCEHAVETTMHNVANMNSVLAVDIYSNLRNDNYSSSTGEKSSVLCRIPTTAFKGDIMRWTNRTGLRQTLQGEHLSSIYLALRDQDGRVLDNNGVEWTIQIAFIFELISK